MEDLRIMQGFKALYNLNKNAPNFLFGQVLLLFLMLCYFLIQITVIRILHHNTNKILSQYFYHNDWDASSMNASWYEQMDRCWMLANILTSLRAFSFSFSDSLPIFTFLSA